MRWLLDTDTCIALIRGHSSIRARVHAESPADFAVASMTEAELRYGALRSRNPTDGLRRLEIFLAAPMEILPFDRAAAHWYAEVRHALKSSPIGPPDMIIASVALANDLTVVTGNVREFGRVPELRVENWSVA